MVKTSEGATILQPFEAAISQKMTTDVITSHCLSTINQYYRVIQINLRS